MNFRKKKKKGRKQQNTGISLRCLIKELAHKPVWPFQQKPKRGTASGLARPPQCKVGNVTYKPLEHRLMNKRTMLENKPQRFLHVANSSEPVLPVILAQPFASAQPSALLQVRVPQSTTHACWKSCKVPGAGNLILQASEPPTPHGTFEASPWASRQKDAQNSNRNAHPVASAKHPAVLEEAARNSCFFCSPLNQLPAKSCSSYGAQAQGQGFHGDLGMPGTIRRGPLLQGRPPAGHFCSTLKRNNGNRRKKPSLRIQNEKMKCAGGREACQRTFRLVPVPS